MFKKLRTVIYHTADIQKAKEWYALATGIQPYFDEAFYVGFDVNGCELGLDPDLKGVHEGNNAVAYWSVDGMNAVVEKLVAAGASIVKEIAPVGGGVTVAEIKDPFGNTIGLIEGA
jgi:predicted enzyme related to lactoylglutathione lyase